MNLDKTATIHEIEFWKRFVTEVQFTEGWLKSPVNPELQPDVVKLIQQNHGASVLDAGSGVVSILRGLVPDDKLTVTDPLSDEFRKIFDYDAHGIRAPLAVAAEDIQFIESHQIVHIRNALDHTSNPVKAFWALERAVAPGGYLIIHGFANEANFENWQGFHQWNIDLIDQRLLITGRAGEINFLTAEADQSRKIILPQTGREWITWIASKSAFA